MIKVCLLWIAFNLKKPYVVESHRNEPCKCSTTRCGFQQGMLPHLKFHFGPMESEAKFIKVLGAFVCILRLNHGLGQYFPLVPLLLAC